MSTGESNASIPNTADWEYSEKGIQSVSLTFSIALYTNALFSEIPEAVIECYEKYLTHCPQDCFRFYASANMRRHKTVTKRTVGMLKTWLKPGAPPMEDILLEIKDGKAYEDAPHFKFAVAAGEVGSASFNGKGANMIVMVFPAEWAGERTDEILEFVGELCSIFPYQSGHAGYSFEISRYSGRPSHTYAWEKSMHHRGIDIARWPQDSHAVGQDALKGVGWLTILCNDYLQRIGGLEQVSKSLEPDIEIMDVPGGVILKAGDEARIGDRNQPDDLPLYRTVYRIVSPLVEIAALRATSFNLKGDFVEKKRHWFRRLADD